MKRFIILLLILCFSFPLLFAREGNSWYLGVSSGYTYDMIKTQTGYKQGLKYLGGHGFSVSVPVTYQINSFMGLSSGLSYVQKNYRFEYNYYELNDYPLNAYENVVNHYLELPLTIDFTLENGLFTTFAGFGGYVGYWVGSNRNGQARGSSYDLAEKQGEYNYYSGSYTFSKADNRFEAGLLFKAGLELDFKPILIRLDLSYSLGLTDMRRNQIFNYSPLINDTLKAEVGLLWGFGGER